MFGTVTRKLLLLAGLAVLTALVVGIVGYLITMERKGVSHALERVAELVMSESQLAEQVQTLERIVDTEVDERVDEMRAEFHASISAISQMSHVFFGGEALEDIKADLNALSTQGQTIFERRKTDLQQLTSLWNDYFSELNQKMLSINTIAYNAAEQELIATANGIENEILRSQIALIRFISEPTKERAEATYAQLATLRSQTKRGRSTFRNVGRVEASALFTSVREFQKFAISAIERRLEIVGIINLFHAEIVTLRNQISEKTQSVNAVQSSVANQKRDRAERLEMGAVAIATLSILIITLVASRIAVGLSRDFKALGAAIRAVASGDNEYPVPTKTRSIEFKEMNLAVTTFQENAKSREAADAATLELRKERSERDRDRVAAAKVAEQTKLDEERRLSEIASADAEAEQDSILRTEIDKVVESVFAGEMHARIDASFSDEARNRIAIKVNSLIEAVDQALSQTTYAVSALSRGDLSQRVEGEFQGAFAVLQSDMNRALEQLSEIIPLIAGVSQSIVTISKQMSLDASKLISGAKIQSEHLGKTRESVENLSSSSEKSRLVAIEVDTLSINATLTADDGVLVSDSAIAAMKQIRDTDYEISRTLSLVEDIATQTKLLGLNAAVEAARAGEAGRGFAVVASEVRSLATKSTEAANSIQELVAEGQKHIDIGLDKVKETGLALSDIKTKSKGVSDAASSIKGHSKEQVGQIENVNMVLKGLETVAQSNTEMSMNGTKNAELLAILAADLEESVSFFSEFIKSRDGTLAA